MRFNKDILQKAADAGSKKVANAFSKLSGTDVNVSVSSIERVSLDESLGRLNMLDEHAVVVYAPLLSDLAGASFLVMSHDDALVLIDLLNHSPVGTTNILKDIDRSAMKETLNVLANSYMSSLSAGVDLHLGLGIPSMITASRLGDIIHILLEKDSKEDDTAMIFDTKLDIEKYKVQTGLYIVFNERLVELMKAT